MYKNVRIPYLSGIFSKLCSNKNKSHRSQSIYPCPNILIPLAKWTIYASILKSKSFFLKFKFKWGGPFAHEVVLMKFELQTHMEHLSSCQSGFLVVCASQYSVFWVFVILCQPLNICLFVMLYLYIYIILLLK